MILVKLEVPEDIRILGLTSYTYNWFNKLKDVVGQLCPDYYFEWDNNGKWIPEYLFVDEETALYLILKHQFKRI